MVSVLLLSAGHDELIGPLVIARLVAAGRLAPRSHRVTSATGLAFTAAMRVIDRVHGYAAVYRAAPQPAGATRFADGNIFVIEIAYLAHRCHAIHKHATGFPGGQLQQRIVAFLGNQLRLGSSRTRHLRALARLQLDVVHGRAGRNVAQRQGVADQNIGLRPANQLRAHFQSDRVHDVALFAVGVIQQRDARRAVGIVLDRGDGSGNTELVALEIDDSQLALVSAAAMPDSEVAGVAASAAALLWFR